MPECGRSEDLRVSLHGSSTQMDNFDDIKARLLQDIEGSVLEELPSDMISVISSYLSSLRVKGHVSTAFCGHTGCGKSTLMDHMIFELKGVPRYHAEFTAQAEKLDPPGSPVGLYLADLDAARKSGRTIASITHEFFTQSKHFTLCDAPSHRDFVKNLISGACGLDIPVLLVPADDTFAASIEVATPKSPLLGQSRTHAHVLRLLGIGPLIVGVNKMDLIPEDKQESRFKEICEQTNQMLIKLGFSEDFVTYCVPKIPISATRGDNLIAPSPYFHWWKGAEVSIRGLPILIKTLFDALDFMVSPPPRNKTGPLRVPISGVYKIKGVGDVVSGRIEQGTLLPGAEVQFLPNHRKQYSCCGTVKGVEQHHKSVASAEAGDNCGFQIEGLEKCTEKPVVGNIMTLLKDDSLYPIWSYTTQVTVLLHPGELRPGYSPIACARTSRVASHMSQINWKIVEGERVANPRSLVANDVAEVVFEPMKPFVLDTYANCPGLGRIALMEGHMVVMIGIVTAIRRAGY